MAVTKDDIVNAVYTNLKLPKNKSIEIVESLLETIKSTLEKGEDVLISGFGKFRVREKRKRKGRNPQTSETMMLKARRVVTFNASGILRDKINGNR